jgi:heterodisulfide reductase subunit C
MNSPDISSDPQPPVGLEELERGFAAEVRRRSGVEMQRCFQCRTCANGCPFVQAMDYPPNAVIRQVQYGLRQRVLESSTIWICVACNTCSSECPMGIDIPAVMDALRRLALEEGAMVAEPDILDFHREVLHSIKRYGRAHKLGIMLRYKARVRRWFADLDVGLKMLAKRKLDLRASRVKAIKEISRLFIPHWQG